ncbi:hypothetical protein PAECIP111893_04419 [Paenibacillus plantiphilus]|uniref:Uncharacterized protein n=1 Tax=Paenibacillus plantiphilus TaxID=2905650 RepID=A0ABN8GUA9_9BACL|nr:hypothetical protein [Paenibacillus plantiphilus]CAH1218369.1 hypothetical protein PAECIP111893_04419 [Paenibacillus plantiphilus]
MKMKGKRDYNKLLLQIERSIHNQVNGGVKLQELFSEAFMKEHTEFKDIHSFFEGGSFEVNSAAELENINKTSLDRHVMENSIFTTWEKMKEAAGQAYLKVKL